MLAASLFSVSSLASVAKAECNGEPVYVDIGNGVVIDVCDPANWPAE